MSRRRSELTLVFFALLLAQALAALDSTVVSTAMPTIISELGGFRTFSWVFSFYLLTYTATIPVYGRLADLLGRKAVLLFAVALFLLGSVLSGLATSMTALILFRGVQGLGAGGVLPIAMTVVGDLFPLEERARAQGWISSVWAISSVVGPTLGGLLVLASWRLIFFVNLPIGCLALWIVARHYREEAEPHPARLDVTGSALLLLWVSALIYGLLQGSSWGWASTGSLLVFALALAGGVAFLLLQLRSSAPLFPLRLLRIPVIGVGDAASFTAGGLTVGLSGFIPTFVQGVDRFSPTVAGLVLTTMSLGWPLASALTGRLLTRTGARAIGVAGGIFTVLGTGLLLTLDPATPVWHIAVMSFLTGLGLGAVNTTAIVLIQDAVPWQERGVATGSNMFARMFGSTLFVAVMGAVLNAGMAQRLRGGDRLVNLLLNPGVGTLPTHVWAVARGALAQSLHDVYLTAFGLALLTFLLELAFPDLGRRRAVVQEEA